MRRRGFKVWCGGVFLLSAWSRRRTRGAQPRARKRNSSTCGAEGRTSSFYCRGTRRRRPVRWGSVVAGRLEMGRFEPTESEGAH